MHKKMFLGFPYNYNTSVTPSVKTYELIWIVHYNFRLIINSKFGKIMTQKWLVITESERCHSHTAHSL